MSRRGSKYSSRFRARVEDNLRFLTLRSAYHWVGKGHEVIPITCDHQPVHADWRNLHLKKGQLLKYFRDGDGIALVMTKGIAALRMYSPEKVVDGPDDPALLEDIECISLRDDDAFVIFRGSVERFGSPMETALAGFDILVDFVPVPPSPRCSWGEIEHPRCGRWPRTPYSAC